MNRRAFHRAQSNVGGSLEKRLARSWQGQRLPPRQRAAMARSYRADRALSLECGGWCRNARVEVDAMEGLQREQSQYEGERFQPRKHAMKKSRGKVAPPLAVEHSIGLRCCLAT